MKKRFSIRSKMIIIFGSLILLSGALEGFLAVRTAYDAVLDKIEQHLNDKASDIAEVVDGKMNVFLTFIRSIAHMPVLRDTSVPLQEKLKFLQNEALIDSKIKEFDLCDLEGFRYTLKGQRVVIADREWYRAAKRGESYVSEPIISRSDGTLIVVYAVPVYDDNKNIINVLLAIVDGTQLCTHVSDIVIGKTGECSILGADGTLIANKDVSRVRRMQNLIEEGKTNPAFASGARFVQYAIESPQSETASYSYEGIKWIASFSRMKITGWTVVIRAPLNEFLGSVEELRRNMIFTVAVILLASVVIVYFVVRKMVTPIQRAVTALKNIAQGEGDLTVRLPLHGNDEITDLSSFFNQTIEKIGKAIRSVGLNSKIMHDIGSELVSNMSETASSVHEVSTNIESVKQQALTQASSVTEMAATIEQIIRTIKQLNGSIENQAASVAESSAAVEQMVANIGSITETLEKTDGVIKTLASATGDGKDSVVNANTVTQKVAEASGSLMEASSVIQHIASQTNLLAMNAAIEAAHAGEAGKGFAVVADEIRKLAEESSIQGKAITSTLKALSNEIEMLSSSSKNAEEKFNTIFSLSEQVKSMSNTLTEAMREQENGSKEVLIAIHDINEITTRVNDGSEEMLRGGENVAKEMHKLDGLTRVISGSMNEMAAGALQISKSIQQVNDISQKNKQSIENLNREVNKFKV